MRIEHVRSRIASYKKPRHFEFVDRLPRQGFAVDYDALDALDAQFGGGYPGGGTGISEELDHEAAIRRLLAEYCHHYDDGRSAEFVARFTEGARFTVFGRSRNGRQEIHDNIGVQQPGMPPGQHVTYTSVIDLAADGLTARAWTDFPYISPT